MSEPERKPERSWRLAALRAAIDDGAVRSAARLINKLHPAEIAQLLESLPQNRREIVWELIDPVLDGDVLVELSDEVRGQLIREMDADELAAAAGGLEVDDLADLIADLPEKVTQQLLHNMDQQDRERLSRVLVWPEDSAGGLMNTDTVSVRADVSLGVVQRYLRMRGELPERTDRLFVVDRADRFLGTVTLASLLIEDPDRPVGSCLDPEAPRIGPEMPAREVAQIFRDRDLVSAAVVEESSGRLLGRITIDDVVDVITEEAAHEVMAGAGLRDEEDVFASVVPAARRRVIWLGFNVISVLLAAIVVKHFEGTIARVAALAALMPIVASMGGIAGTQTVTLLIRGMALGQVEWRDARWLLLREIGVSCLTGAALALLIGLIALVWMGTWDIALILVAALFVNMVSAAVVGTMIPLTLRKLGIDPALSAGVILTAFTDAVGFAALLGLGAIFLT